MSTKTIKQPTIAVNTKNGILFINEIDIIYCQAQGSYTYLFLEDPTPKKITISKSLNKVLETLGSDQFIRIHQSFAVNLVHVVRYDRAPKNVVVMSSGISLPVSRNRKDGLMDSFNIL